MPSYQDIILNLRKVLSFCLVVIVLLSLSNGFIFQFTDLPLLDSIECADSTGEEKEAESEKESKKEGIDDEFLGIHSFSKLIISANLDALNAHCYYRDNTSTDIVTPPPEFI